MLTLEVNRREFLKIGSRAGRNPARLTSMSPSPRSVASCLANASCTLVGAEPPAGAIWIPFGSPTKRNSAGK
jgi:hypothetical protein